MDKRPKSVYDLQYLQRHGIAREENITRTSDLD
jgi:hypothetical protein